MNGRGRSTSNAWALRLLVSDELFSGIYADLIERYPRFERRFEAEEMHVAQAGDLAVVRGAYRFTPGAEVQDKTETGKFVGV